MWVNDILIVNWIVLQPVNKICKIDIFVLWKSDYVSFLLL
jgi:hypothetical protein